MNFNLIFFCSSPVQKLVWVDSIKWFKVLFPSWIRLIFCIGERPDVLCTSKTQVCLDDTNDEYLDPRHYHCMIYQGTPYARGFPRTLTVRNAFWLKRALIFSHIGTVYTNKYSLSICRIGMRSGDWEASCLKSPGHCTTPVCTVKTPEAYQRVKASVLCTVQTAS